MREFRMGRNTTEYYTSFQDLGAAWGCRSVNKKTKDKKKLLSQQEKFMNSNCCKACGSPMAFMVDSNIMCCTSELCKGIKHQSINEATGETKVWYTPSYKVLDKKSADIAMNIFS